jgi:nucleotide-binding universal stress UspA family protein
MSYASILVHVDTAEAAAPRLASARFLAESFDATLVGLAAEMIPPLISDTGFYGVSGDWYAVMREDIEGRLRAARKTFNAATTGLSKPTLWECGIQYPANAMEHSSRGADLIVASSNARGGQTIYRDADPAELAMVSGRPVLVVPPNGGPLDARRVVLAWKDTREARRALSDAMPFFERAEAVLVLEVCPAAEAADAKIRTDDVAEALRRHGANAEPMVASHHSADGHEILRQASLFGAGLVVAGSYGHSRLGEWVFGGVTRDLLSQDQTYVLLSH